MPATRSSSRKQATLDELTESNRPTRSKNTLSKGAGAQANVTSDASRKSAKRKQDEQHNSNETPATKKAKKQQQHSAPSGAQESKKSIVINRAPVLQLWGTVVAHFLHPGLSWQACLSIGNAISTLCAISKGKAIGKIEPKEDADSTQRQDQKEEAKQNSEEVSVMGFPLRLKDDAVLMGGKPKRFDESALKGKFGEAHYEAAKKAMSEHLESWSKDKDELDRKAFHMYEKFRPNVAKGQTGWGRKGELSLDEVASVVKRSA